MIVNILILALGVAIGVAAVVLRKKIGIEWMVSLLCGAVLVAAVGGVFTWASWKDAQEDKQHVYVALQYLQHQQTDSASYHLKKVEGDSFASTGSEALLETMRGNSILVQLKLDAMEGFTKNDEQRGIAARLKNLSQYDYESIQTLVNLLIGQLKLSEEQKKAADILFVSESGYYVDGLEMEEQTLGEQDALRGQINSCLNNGSYSGAVSAAVQLVDVSASAENRLLLADTIAEAIYNGEYLSGYEFSSETEETPNAVQEREKLQEKIEKLTQESENLQLLIDGAADEEKAASYTTDLADKTAQIRELEEQQDYLFARRALSAIADLHSLEAAVVRARLYYAMLDYDEAVECLQKAASSPAAWFSTDSNLRDAFEILKKAYSEAKTTGTQSVEFQDAITTLLSSCGYDLISIATSNLTESFTTYIVTDQKTYGKDLYSTGVDVSNYPEIVVRISGRDTVLDVLMAQKDVIVRDTHHDVSYTVVVPDSDSAYTNICCVVDESGSMSGEPTMNLRSALSGFIDALDGKTNLGIVGFEDGYTIHAAMSENLSAAKAAVNNIRADGGTNITAGIRGAMEAMKDCIGRKTVLLMTDGQSDIDMSVVQEAAAQGYVIHCIGFGGVNDELLQQIADATGGQYIKAETSSELVNIYLSLVGMIGNEVEIHYTVTEQVTEEVIRYFFVRIPGYEVSLRVEYLMPETVEPELDRVYPSVVYESTAESGWDMTFELYGESLLDVTEVTVGGQEAEIVSEPSDSYIQIQVPSGLENGWQTVTLIREDGTQTSFEKMICVVEELAAHSFQAGELMLYADQAGLTDDGMLILGNSVAVTDEQPDSGKETTLSMNVSGLLAMPVDVAALEAQLLEDPYAYRLEVTLLGSMEGAGWVYLNSDDSGYAYNANDQVASGMFTVNFADSQIYLVQD